MGWVLEVGIAVAFLWFGLQWFAHAQMYFPDPVLVAAPSAMGLSFEDALITTEDGRPIHGWYVPADPPGRFTVLFCHGNAGNISHRLDKAAMIHALGLNAFFFDYRGYGRSRGRPSETGLYRDGEAAWKYLTEARGQAPQAVVLYGESLGGGVAVELARRHPAAGLVLESTFTSMVDMGRRFFPWLPVGLIVRDRYDNLSKMRSVTMPVLVLHSRADELIPFTMGLQLAEAARGPRRLAELQGSHNEGFLMSRDRYQIALRQFIQELESVKQ